jgi:sulfur relay (sulfurtransferase) DsrC/TusE family protein
MSAYLYDVWSAEWCLLACMKYIRKNFREYRVSPKSWNVVETLAEIELQQGTPELQIRQSECHMHIVKHLRDVIYISGMHSLWTSV